MSYAPQIPWLQQSSIRNNIVCCEPWDSARYKAVVHACALEADLQNMPLGDDTPIAEKGISLSGGQKQRVALARAAYRNADIYILDNPISALDDQTQEHIWKHLIEGLLQHATIIVGSSRPVISCTAILFLTPDGLAPREPHFCHGWCADQRTEAPPPRYSRYNVAPSTRPEVARAVPAEVPARINRVPTTRGRQGLESSMTIEDSAVSDVRAEIQEYEKFSDAVLSHAAAGNKTELSDLSARFLPSNRAVGRTGSFVAHHLSQPQSRGSKMASRRKSLYSSVLTSHEDSEVKVKVDVPSDLPSKQPKVVCNEDDFTPSSSEAGFVQWIRACDISFSFAFILVLAYVLNQFGRSYYSLWAAWWNGQFFGISSSNYNYGLIGLFGSQLVFRVRGFLECARLMC